MLIQNIEESVTIDIGGNPDLYITKIPSGKQSLTGWEDYDYYINNAKVIGANQRGKSLKGKDQVCSFYGLRIYSD